MRWQLKSRNWKPRPPNEVLVSRRLRQDQKRPRRNLVLEKQPRQKQPPRKLRQPRKPLQDLPLNRAVWRSLAACWRHVEGEEWSIDLLIDQFLSWLTNTAPVARHPTATNTRAGKNTPHENRLIIASSLIFNIQVGGAQRATARKSRPLRKQLIPEPLYPWAC